MILNKEEKATLTIQILLDSSERWYILIDLDES
jgi:hypothetical protein